VAAGDPLPAAARLRATGDAGLDAAAVAHLMDRYDDEIAFVDARLGDWLDLLARRGLLRRSVVAVVADHGESFLEHGHLRHCRSLYDEELRVPLIVRPPGGVPAPGRRVAGPATLLDVTPTLLDYAGVAAPAGDLAGRSLRPWVDGVADDALDDDGGRRSQTALAASQRALVSGRFKLHYDLESGGAALFDLAADPGETRDVAAERPAETRRLLALLDRHLRAVEGEGLDASPERLERSGESERQLRALGYLR
jgi:arylsulfatase A-like enzyme